MIKMHPERREFEAEVRKLYTDGDITAVANQMQIGRTVLSKSLNPGVEEHKSTFFTTTRHLWALDVTGRIRTADRIIGIMNRERAFWLPARSVMSNPAKTSSQIIREVAEFLEEELDGAPDEILFKEADDILRAVHAKLDEIRYRREARMLGLDRIAA